VLDKITTLLFLLGIITLFLVGIMTYRYTMQLRDSITWVAHTQEVLKKLQEITSEITDVQTDQRGYILSGDASFLEYYDSRTKEIQDALKEVRRLTSDNKSQTQRLDILEPLIAQRIDIANEIIAIRKEKGFEPALQLFNSGKGKILMDKVRKVLDVMEAEENRLLILREAKSTESQGKYIFHPSYRDIYHFFNSFFGYIFTE
jgi:CHASE3 domain sensor protein